jgi:hypothetical protein
MTGNTGFNLMDEPWIMVLGHDGQERQESILGLFEQAVRSTGPAGLRIAVRPVVAGELCVRHRHRDFELIGLSVPRVEVGSGALTEASAAVLESRQRVLAQLPYHCSAPICAAARVPISLSAAVQPGDIHHSGCRP